MSAPYCQCGHTETAHDAGRCTGEQVRFRPLRSEPCPCTEFERV